MTESFQMFSQTLRENSALVLQEAKAALFHSLLNYSYTVMFPLSECCGRMVYTTALYNVHPRFEYRSGDRSCWLNFFVSFFSHSSV